MDDEKTNPGKSRSGKTVSKATPIGPHLVASGDFIRLYKEGMALIEEVAAYLDGEGRDQSRGLGREAGVVVSEPNAGALAVALETVIRNDRPILSHAARGFARRHRWEEVARRVEGVGASLVPSRRRHRRPEGGYSM